MFLFSTLVVICFVSVMICLSNILLVAYFTLQERQVLAATQLRKGPNFVGFLGLAQPLSDASKLLLKELVVPKRSNYFIFVSIPGVMLMLSISL